MCIFKILAMIFIYSTVAVATNINKHILLTAFEPFGGSFENRSIDTANVVKEELEKKGFKVDICVLPVVYDLAAKTAKDCYASFGTKPSAVISLGEGGCDIRMETAAQNRDSASGFPDNLGNIRTNSVIENNGPSKIGFRTFVADMYCTLSPRLREMITVSESPGGYVCNNTAFHLGKYFSDLKIPYTFIHVPNSYCSQGNSKSIESGNILSEMINSFYQFKLKERIYSFENLCSTLPISIDELNNFKNIMKSQEKNFKKACGDEFLVKLEERLKQWKEKDTTF